jgi:hypothetical protein
LPPTSPFPSSSPKYRDRQPSSLLSASSTCCFRPAFSARRASNLPSRI